MKLRTNYNFKSIYLTTVFFILLFVIPSILKSQTDYSQMSNWYYHPAKPFNYIETYNLDIAVINKDLQVDSIIEIENNAGVNTGVDVFWVHPTHLTNPPLLPSSVAIADQDQTVISLAILAQGALLSKYGRFFAPKYRQASPSSFLGMGSTELQRATALIDTYSDIKAAFLNYLNNHNNGNKIILAGHSQGSFLLGMLLRDVFDNDQQLRDKLVAASLGGMMSVYSSSTTFNGGWWQNIPLCTYTNECGCVHAWRSYKESLAIPELDSDFPSFNQVLVDSGLVYRTTDLTNDLLSQDSLFYGAVSSPLRYYIAPNAGYSLAPTGYNNIAFDSLYTIRVRRESSLKIGTSVEKVAIPNDLRPNDIDSLSASPLFDDGDLHYKDYHIYIWALMEQIDSKLEGCNINMSINKNVSSTEDFVLYPNPSNGSVKIKLSSSMSSSDGNKLRILNTLGQVIQTVEMNSNEKLIHIGVKGIYYINSSKGCKKLIIN